MALLPATGSSARPRSSLVTAVSRPPGRLSASITAALEATSSARGGRRLAREDFVHARGDVGQPLAAAALDFGAAPADVTDLAELRHAPRPIDVAFEQLGLK